MFATDFEVRDGARTLRPYCSDLPPGFMFVDDAGMAQRTDSACDLGVVSHTEPADASIVVISPAKYVHSSLVLPGTSSTCTLYRD